MRKIKLAGLLKEIYVILKKLEPDKETYDVLWHSPYFIPRPHQWHPSNFVLYNGCLFCQLVIEGHYYSLSWEIGALKINFERGWGPSGPYMNEYLWNEALPQIYKRLKKAVNNPEGYNRFVIRLLPFECRTGKIKRQYTWEKKVKSAIPMIKIHALEQLLDKSAKLPKLLKMTLRMYLEVVGIAKDAVFKESRNLSLVEKYKKRADMRHGGLLDLPLDDASAFEKWYHGGRWAGSHPWEIVFGHPHGIELAARHDKDGWAYALWVDSLYWYGSAAYMAIAMAKDNVPFDFYRSKEVIDALKGIDDVEVGPSYPMISLEELKESRPDALQYIRWDPIPQIKLISQKQKERVILAERKSRETTKI